jgi:uncharacterized protein
MQTSHSRSASDCIAQGHAGNSSSDSYRSGPHQARHYPSTSFAISRASGCIIAPIARDENGTELDFQWDEANVLHIAVHGVTPLEAEAAVINSNVVIGRWYIRRSEWRLNIIGRAGKRVLFVVVTTRDPLVRVVSARDANRKERQQLPEAL